MADTTIKVRTWVKASDAEIRSGLLGYLSFHFEGLVLDGVTLRRKSDGGFALSWPAKTDRGGRRHAYVRPVDDRVRRAIERDVLAQLGQREDGRDAAEGQT